MRSEFSSVNAISKLSARGPRGTENAVYSVGRFLLTLTGYIVMMVTILLSFLNTLSFGDVEFLKYRFSILGIRAGEANVFFDFKGTNIVITSRIKTYPGVRLFINVNDVVVSHVDRGTLKTLRRDVWSEGESFKDTNFAVFDREKGEIFIQSAVLGKVYIHNTNDSVNDLATEVFKATYWDKLPSEVTVNFLEVTNVRSITLKRHKKGRFLVKEIKDAYVELTNVGGRYIFSRADIPVLYLFPFGNIGIYVELSDVGFSSRRE